MYTELKENDVVVTIRRDADNANIPLDEDNYDYKEFLDWLAEPNTPASEEI